MSNGPIDSSDNAARESAHRDDIAEPKAPRYRLATDVDLSAAKPGCRRCGGRGINGYSRRETKDGIERVPIVCRCVTRRGGVKEDDADRMMRKLAAEAFFHKVLKASPDEQRKVVASLEADLLKPNATDESKRYIREWIGKIKAVADTPTA